MKRIRLALWQFFRTYPEIYLDNFDTGRRFRFPMRMKRRLAYVIAELFRRKVRFKEGGGLMVICPTKGDT